MIAMPRIQFNIEEFSIAGQPEILIDHMAHLTSIVHEYTEDVNRFKSLLRNKQDDNDNDQLERAFYTTVGFIRKLDDDLDDLTDVHVFLIEFVNRVNRFNDHPPCDATPIRYDHHAFAMDFSHSRQTMVINDMIVIANALDDVILDGIECVKSIRRETESMGTVWTDRQYRLFSECTEEICNDIISALEPLDDYHQHLIRIITHR